MDEVITLLARIEQCVFILPSDLSEISLVCSQEALCENEETSRRQRRGKEEKRKGKCR